MKTPRIPLLRFLPLLVTAALFAACSTGPANPLAGTWKTDPSLTNKFASPNISMEPGGVLLFDQTRGNWTLSNDQSKITWDFRGVLPKEFSYSIQDDVLTLSDNAGVAIQFKRASP